MAITEAFQSEPRWGPASEQTPVCLVHIRSCSQEAESGLGCKASRVYLLSLQRRSFSRQAELCIGAEGVPKSHLILAGVPEWVSLGWGEGRRGRGSATTKVAACTSTPALPPRSCMNGLLGAPSLAESSSCVNEGSNTCLSRLLEGVEMMLVRCVAHCTG